MLKKHHIFISFKSLILSVKVINVIKMTIHLQSTLFLGNSILISSLYQAETVYAPFLKHEVTRIILMAINLMELFTASTQTSIH